MKSTGAKWFQIVMVALTLEITLISILVEMISIIFEMISILFEILVLNPSSDFK